MPLWRILIPYLSASACHLSLFDLPISVIISQDLTRSISLRVAHAAVGPIRSVQNVEEIQVFCAASIISFVPTTAEIAKPLPIVLLNTAISGLTPYLR